SSWCGLLRANPHVERRDPTRRRAPTPSPATGSAAGSPAPAAPPPRRARCPWALVQRHTRSDVRGVFRGTVTGAHSMATMPSRFPVRVPRLPLAWAVSRIRIRTVNKERAVDVSGTESVGSTAGFRLPVGLWVSFRVLGHDFDPDALTERTGIQLKG